MSHIIVDIPPELRGDVREVRSRFQAAIDACAAAGGGRVEIPAGTYAAASIHLRSRVTLAMDPGCTLVSPLGREDFEMLPIPPESNYAKGFAGKACGVIDALGAEGAAVEGGRIDGRGDNFWTPKETVGELWNSTPPRYWAKPFRPMSLLLWGCRGLSVRGLTVVNSPAYSAWVCDSAGAYFGKVSVVNDFYGPNTDGFHFSSCSGVLVDGCDFLTGDDSIAVDACSTGFSHDIEIRNCVFDSSVNVIRVYTGLDTGLAREGGYSEVRGVALHDCRVKNAAGVLNVTAQDGSIRDVAMFKMDIAMRQEGTPFFLMTDRGEIEGVRIRDVRAFSNGVGTVIGTGSHFVSGVSIRNMAVKVRPVKKLYQTDIPDPIPGYAHHHFAPCNLYIRHARDVDIRDLSVEWVENPDFTPAMSALFLHDARDVSVEGLAAGPYGKDPSVPAAAVRGCRRVSFIGCRVPDGVRLVSLDGTAGDISVR